MDDQLETERKTFLKQIDELRVKDPRISYAVVSRMLGKNETFAYGIFRGYKMPADVWNKWSQILYPQLKKRTDEYAQISNDELYEIANRMFLNNSDELERRLNINRNSIGRQLNERKLKFMLNAYDVYRGYELYPSNKRQNYQAPLLKQQSNLIDKLTKNINELKKYGINMHITEKIGDLPRNRIAGSKNRNTHVRGRRYRNFKDIFALQDALLAIAKEKHAKDMRSALNNNEISEEEIELYLKRINKDASYFSDGEKGRMRQEAGIIGIKYLREKGELK